MGLFFIHSSLFTAVNLPQFIYSNELTISLENIPIALHCREELLAAGIGGNPNETDPENLTSDTSHHERCVVR